MLATAADPVRTARLFQVLSDPTRLRILARLTRGERCVCELTDLLDAQQSRLSFHLRVLRESGLVSDRRDGRWVHYTLNREALGPLSVYLEGLADGTLPQEPGSAGCCG